MYQEKTIGVVVPSYNEEQFVGEVVETIPSYVDRVYVIDDASTDDTWKEIERVTAAVNDRDGDAEAAGPFEDTVVPIRHAENKGVGGAIKTGYLQARDDGIDVTVVMGGDGQMDPEELEPVIRPVVDGRVDYAKGNRFMRDDVQTEMPRFRYVGNVILSLLTKIATGYWGVSDPQNGYTAISHDALEGADIEDMYEFYGYCNDLLVRLSVNGFRVADVPVSPVYGDETSHISYPTYIPRVSAMLLRTFLWRLSVQRDGPEETARSALYVLGAVTVLRSIAPFRVRRLRNAGAGVLLLTLAMIADAILHRNETDRFDE